MKLVLIGKEIINVPQREDMISLGFVSETDKYDAMAGYLVDLQRKYLLFCDIY